MLLEHTLAAVQDMVNRYKYLPQLIIVHLGASDFSRVTNHQIWINIQNMVLNCKKITTAACRSTDSFCGFMFSLMLSLPFYILQAVWRAKARFNGSLAKHAQLNGGYIIRHPDIWAVTDLGLYNPNNQGDLRDQVLVDDERHRTESANNSSTITVALARRKQPMAMNNVIQAARQWEEKNK